MIVDVRVGPCPDPGSTPGVSTIFMESILIVILLVVFVWLFYNARKQSKRSAQKKRDIVDRIKRRER